MFWHSNAYIPLINYFRNIYKFDSKKHQQLSGVFGQFPVTRFSITKLLF
jgi:hypothetical protein